MTNESICALATKAGGAISIIRISGNDCIAITDKVFHSPKGQKLSDARPYTVHYGDILDQEGEVIDDVLVTVFHAPHSYTGENSIEISCHGSQYIIQQILHTLIEKGCRQAGPGEYTKRAYLNGKMDLSQAEAVADLIGATNKATHRLAMSQLKGHFSNKLSLLREQLLKMTSLLELELDFSDHEELEFADRSELKALAKKIESCITALTQSFATGNALKKGIPVAIIGKTNVGKSTLLNQLLQEDKAIVSDVDGTTRDVIEDTIDIDGITFRFIDTAGIRKTEDKVEKIGIERTYQKLDEATVVLWMLDAQPTKAEAADMADRTQGKQVIIVHNKTDILVPDTCTAYSLEPYAEINISAKQGKGIKELEQLLYKAADIPEIEENSVIVTSARHYEALLRAQESIGRVIDGMAEDLSGDLLAEDLRMCLDELGEITGGAITPNEVLNNIFKHFCIGK
jgi:tRNA modification GTPase